MTKKQRKRLVRMIVKHQAKLVEVEGEIMPVSLD